MTLIFLIVYFIFGVFCIFFSIFCLCSFIGKIHNLIKSFKTNKKELIVFYSLMSIVTFICFVLLLLIFIYVYNKTDLEYILWKSL